MALQVTNSSQSLAKPSSALETSVRDCEKSSVKKDEDKISALNNFSQQILERVAAVKIPYPQPSTLRVTRFPWKPLPYQKVKPVISESHNHSKVWERYLPPAPTHCKWPDLRPSDKHLTLLVKELNRRYPRGRDPYRKGMER